LSSDVIASTPRLAFEVARLLDRTGDGIVADLDGVLTVLVDVYRHRLAQPRVGARP
jgi:hypothetical protein